MKKCTKCKLVKNRDQFYKGQANRDGLQSRCMKCCKKYRYIPAKPNKEYRRRYRKTEKSKRMQAVYQKRYIAKCNKNPIALIHLRITSKVSNVMSGKKQYKSIFVFLGYTPKALKEHLESQFTEGMTWDNYGLYGWHIDHIIPRCFFNFDDIVEFKYCWSLHNLQPLWAKDNLKKGSKLPSYFQP